MISHSMSKQKFIALLFLLISASYLRAQTSTIKGIAPDYAGMELPVFTFSDFISEEKTELGKIHFQADGTFSVAISLPTTTVCFTEFDIYQAMIYVEPGKTYEIQFPPRQVQSEAQKRNPFFKLQPVWFRIVNQSDDDINLKIKNFETEFRVLEDKHFYDIYEKHSKASVETVRVELQKKFPKSENKFFEAHKKYRMGNLEFALNQGKSPDFIATYFGKVSPMLTLPAYTDLFQQMFSNYFSFLGNSVHDQKITGLVNSGEVQVLENYLTEKNSWNTDFCQLLILKSLKDAYFSGQFSKQAIIRAFSQVEKTNWNDRNKRIARNVLKDITYLTVGSKAPKIEVQQINGKKLTLDEFRGKFVYLHFTDLQNPICRQHMDALKPIADQFRENLVVVFLTEGKTPDAEARKWTGIFATSDETCKNAYKVKTFPTSYLVNRKGKFAESPALNPLNGFASQLRKILEKDRIEKLRGK